MSETIKPYVEYYEGRSDSWTWIDGTEHWWEKFIVWLNGFDGLGQYVCERRWRWNGSATTLRTDYVHLPASEVEHLHRLLASATKPPVLGFFVGARQCRSTQSV